MNGEIANIRYAEDEIPSDDTLQTIKIFETGIAARFASNVGIRGDANDCLMFY